MSTRAKTSKGGAPRPARVSESPPRLLSFLPLDVLNHRHDVLLWSVMFAVTMKHVGMLREVRHQEILDLAEARAHEQDWPATAARYEREQITVESPSPRRFDLVLTKGEYPDQFLRVIFELRDQRGIGKRCEGPWPKCPPPDIVRHVLRPDEVPSIIAAVIVPALAALAARMESVPRVPFVESAEGNPDEPYSAQDRRIHEGYVGIARRAREQQREDARLARLADREITPIARHLDDAIHGRGFDSVGAATNSSPLGR